MGPDAERSGADLTKKTSKKATANKKKPAGRSTAATGSPKVAAKKKVAKAKPAADAANTKSKASASPAKAAKAKPAGKPSKKGAKPAPSAEATKPGAKPAKDRAKASGKKAAAKTAPAAAPAAETKTADAKHAKSGRKGITIVTPKPVKKPKSRTSSAAVPALSGSVFGMGFGSGKPLIPSGPALASAAEAEAEAAERNKKPKSPFNKRQLDQYREILLAKRRDLLGDIGSMEHEALKSQSGSLSNLPQHMAEQGSETYEQSLSLDLAAADRGLLREIEAALDRITERTYGLCEHTGKPISKERLAELPWARYSIEAAREMERRAR